MWSASLSLVKCEMLIYSNDHGGHKHKESLQWEVLINNNTGGFGRLDRIMVWFELAQYILGVYSNKSLLNYSCNRNWPWEWWWEKIAVLSILSSMLHEHDHRGIIWREINNVYMVLYNFYSSPLAHLIKLHSNGESLSLLMWLTFYRPYNKEVKCFTIVQEKCFTRSSVDSRAAFYP